VRQEDRLVTWKLVYTRQAQKDAKKVVAAGLKAKAVELMEILERNPFETPPPYEKLKGDLTGACSRRISVQHRLVYQVLEKERIVKIIRLWTHYE
jgi:Txe/YoeB family toxin of toxin-antitoxin system